MPAPTKFPILNVRVPEEQIDVIKQVCEANGISVSEYIRGLIEANLNNMPPGTLMLDVNAGYRQARALASRIAHAMINQAAELVPDSYEEALVRYHGLSSPGRPPGR